MALSWFRVADGLAEWARSGRRVVRMAEVLRLCADCALPTEPGRSLDEETK